MSLRFYAWLSYPLPNLKTYFFPDASILSLILQFFPLFSYFVTDPPTFPLILLFCHWSSYFSPDPPILSLILLCCHWSTHFGPRFSCFVTDPPILSLILLFCHWSSHFSPDPPTFPLILLFCPSPPFPPPMSLPFILLRFDHIFYAHLDTRHCAQGTFLKNNVTIITNCKKNVS